MRLDRLQQGLFVAATVDGGPAVVWSRGEVPRSEVAGDLLALTVIAGPTAVHRPHAHGGTVQQVVESVPITVTTSTDGARYLVRCNAFDYYVDAAAESTTTTLRDALLADIVAGELGAVTGSTVGAAGMLLSAASAGAIWELSLTGPLAAGDPALADSYIEVSTSTRTASVSLQAFSRNREPRNDALAVITAAIERLRRRDVQEQLARYGLGLWRYGAMIDLSAISGAHWETRYSVDLVVALRSVLIEPVGIIEQVNFAVNAVNIGA